MISLIVSVYAQCRARPLLSVIIVVALIFFLWALEPIFMSSKKGGAVLLFPVIAGTFLLLCCLVPIVLIAGTQSFASDIHKTNAQMQAEINRDPFPVSQPVNAFISDMYDQAVKPLEKYQYQR